MRTKSLPFGGEFVAEFRQISAVVVKKTSSFSEDWKPSLWRRIRGKISQNSGRHLQEHLEALVWTESFPFGGQFAAKFRKISAVVVKKTSSFSVDWKLFLWRPIRGQISQNFGCRRQEDLKL